MATVILGAVGASLGGGISGTILGMSGAVIGQAVGSFIGSIADQWIMARLSPQQRVETPRLESTQVTSSTEGTAIPRVYGRVRLAGNLIWATDFRQEITSTQKRVSKFQKTTVEESAVFVSFAVALCEGEVSAITRIWADGEPLDMDGITWRWYPGTETQTADSFISAKTGPTITPAYRGTAYAVFEELEVTPFGNRIPMLSFEIVRPLAEVGTMESDLRAITLIPGATEFGYATDIVRAESSGGFESDDTGEDEPAENENARAGVADILVSLDYLQASAPNLESVSLVVAWFGDDLRAGTCTIKPKVMTADKSTDPEWLVDGIDRASAAVLSDVDGIPVYGGTPSDASIVQAIQEIKARGLRVTFYPFVMMDIPTGNTLPNPYSNNAATAGQAVLPWRGRITCSPAAGYTGTVDKTATAATQVDAFFGTAQASDFDVDGETVSWTGGSDWGMRRMILHYAHLCAAAGGVDTFLIGSEMRGLTTIRSATSTYPAVTEYVSLAGDVRGILGTETQIGYAADWSEYFGHQPGDGSGDVHFHLDPLWADTNINFVGIDNYMPLSDWRDGFDHLDAEAGWLSIYDAEYLKDNISGGEGYDWYYASDADRTSQTRTAITDGAYSKPWVFRYKDLVNWWSESHYNRPGGTESGSPTAWVPESKPIRFTEFGCPAIDRGTNQPNVFYDPKSSESAVPYFSRAWRDDKMQRAYIQATATYWADGGNNPVSTVYADNMVDWSECAAWTWDARPYPHFPTLDDLWADGTNWRVGHWLTGRLGSVDLATLLRTLCVYAGLSENEVDVTGVWGSVEGFVVTTTESARASVATLGQAYGIDAVETEGVIKFVMRGRAPAATVVLDETVSLSSLPLFELARGGNSTDLYESTRGQESELPAIARWTALRSDDDRYDTVAVEALRTTAVHPRVAAAAFPFAIPPEELERLCRADLAETWTAREGLAFHLPPSALALDPCDVLSVETAAHTLTYRLLALTDSTTRNVEAVRQDREDRDIGPNLARTARVWRPPALFAPAVALLDLPLLYETHDAHKPFIAATSDPWPDSMAVYASYDSGTTWLAMSVFNWRSQLGVLLEDLPAARVSLFDRGPGTKVRMLTGTLSSVSELEMLNGANLMAVESGDGWELIQFRDATLLDTQTWQLTWLLRGRRGTEWAIADPIPSGARVVFMAPEIPELSIAKSQIGIPLLLRIGPASLPVTDARYIEGTFTPEGVGLEPLSPVHLRARHDGTDVQLSWIRRDRSLEADEWGYADIPMTENTEKYSVQILDGADVVRTITHTTQEVTYTAAQQTTDWGAPLLSGDLLTFRVAQISAKVGVGRYTTATREI